MSSISFCIVVACLGDYDDAASMADLQANERAVLERIRSWREPQIRVTVMRSVEGEEGKGSARVSVYGGSVIWTVSVLRHARNSIPPRLP
jgi:hypothetical protein